MVTDSSRAAVFFDRDGVLNVYLPGDYVKSPAELTLLPGAGAAVRRVNEAGMPALVISNQQGVARGVMTAADLQAVDAALKSGLDAEGGVITQSYYCPHAASAHCACRKPQPGMLLQAAEEHDLDLAASAFIGDTETDAQAARAAGVGAFVLVLTGKLRDADGIAAAMKAANTPAPDHIAHTLMDAVAWIVARRGW